MANVRQRIKETKEVGLQLKSELEDKVSISELGYRFDIYLNLIHLARFIEQ